MTKRTLLLTGALAAAALTLTACAGGGAAPGGGGGGDAAAKFDIDAASLATTTEPGAHPVAEVTWNLPYEPMSLDPMLSFNYAENTVDSNTCEGLTRITPDLTIENALAEKIESPDDTTYVYTLRSGVTFWDGTPLTADDVVYSLGRQVGPETASYWTDYFQNVASVEKSGENQVTVKLTQPDALFEQGMSSAAGAIVQQAAAEAAGEQFGTPQGGMMCTGPFQLESWEPGKAITLVKNENYWDEQLIPKVEKLSFSFIADESTAVNALRSGDVDGQFFYLPPAGLSQLEGSDASITFGKSYIFWSLRAIQETGTFSNPKVREALLAAIDSRAITDVVFQGAAIPSPVLTGPAYYGDDEAGAMFQEAFDSYEMQPDIAHAKELLADAGDISAPIVLGVQGSSAVHEQTANLIQAAGQAIGLTIETKVIPVEQFGNLYFDPKAREGLDGFFTTYYGNVTDPLDVYTTFMPESTNNFIKYDGAAEELTDARKTLDPVKRAEYTIAAQEKITRDLPWLPMGDLPVILVQNTEISGATASSAYLGYPWAATIGGVE
ncbi:peptide/nickel transport system substrate-binding protein [Leucobacter luti]|uniref:ABC transporter substrate-binding protein n=1 Tax=Leucobacter luti TaxID=340320 RepID=UPI00104E2745|nr:ABC transporter substrate-binding protein [Leucobacter luti]MCW2289412.1 peptide/nickel transport system substrate-binding protein [Leucobacter luti]TCK39971.1 peptide/nickel transport system substrate-binding protein [Leucobacter luti]